MGEYVDPFDLDQLTGVAEGRRTEERARRVVRSEPAGHRTARVGHAFE